MIKQELKKELLNALTKQLNSMKIPYNPPLDGEALSLMCQRNPKGYQLLMRYLELKVDLEKVDK